MFWNLTMAEQTKIYKRALPWVLLAILAGMTLLINAIEYLTLPADLASAEAQATLQKITWPGSLLNAPGVAAAGGGLGALIIVILVGVVAGQEYGWRSLHLWLSQGISRTRLLLAKFFALVGAACVLALAPLLVGGAATFFLTQRLSDVITPSSVELAPVVLGFLRVVYTLPPYIALALLLAVIGRSTVVPVAGGLLFSLLFEGFLPQLLGLLGESWARLGFYLPHHLASSLLTLNQATGAIAQVDLGSGPQLVAPAIATAGIALWTLIFLGGAVWAFRRQDLTG
jgi:ABC-type transport system involved in multi-copper enzyme maturation permease subunit